jgi:galactokinase
VWFDGPDGFTFWKKDHFMKLDCRSYDFEQIPFDFSDLSIVLFNSRVKHNLASSEYNLRRASCERVVGIISQKKEGVTALRDLSLDDLAQFKALIDPIDYMRAEYVLEENDRVHQMVDAIKAKNLALMGKLMSASHLGLKEKYEVSCPELDFLVDSAHNTPGIVGVRMMGGGFGGCTINLVENAQKEQFIEAMTIKFEKKYLKTALYYVTTPIDI